MPVYFFHLRGPAGVERDETGIDFPDVEAAYLDAYRTVPTLSAELIRDGANPFSHAFEITDADGALLLDLPFTELLRAGRRPPVARTLTQMQRADDLVTSLHRQVERLQENMRISKAWLEAAKTTKR